MRLKAFKRLTLISRTFFLSSLRLRSLIGRPLTELDGSDDKLPCLRLAFLKCPSIRPGRAPSIFNTSLYIVSSPSSCDLMCRNPCVSVSESLTDWPAPHCPPSSESKSSDLVVVDVKSSRPKTERKPIQSLHTINLFTNSRWRFISDCSCFFVIDDRICSPRFCRMDPGRPRDGPICLFFPGRL